MYNCLELSYMNVYIPFENSNNLRHITCSDTCVKRFPVLSNIDVHFHLIILYRFYLDCVIWHPFYSDTHAFLPVYVLIARQIPLYQTQMWIVVPTAHYNCSIG